MNEMFGINISFIITINLFILSCHTLPHFICLFDTQHSSVHLFGPVVMDQGLYDKLYTVWDTLTYIAGLLFKTELMLSEQQKPIDILLAKVKMKKSRSV